MSIYKEAVEQGLEIDNHYSDLYIKATVESKKLIEKYKDTTAKMANVFTSNIDGTLWWDVPFAFEPYWDDL